MNSKAIAIVIIGVSIFVLVLSSAIGDPPDEIPYVFLIPPAKAQILANSAVTAVNTGSSSRLPAGAGAGHGDGNMVCPSATEFNPRIVIVSDLSLCTFAWRGEPSTGWRCDGKVESGCVGDFLLNATNPPDLRRPIYVFDRAA